MTHCFTGCLRNVHFKEVILHTYVYLGYFSVIYTIFKMAANDFGDNL